MLYCNNCGQQRGWPINTPSQSHGRCEICGTGGSCNSLPSSQLHSAAAISTGDLTQGDPESWLSTVWDALSCHRENGIPEGDEAYDREWSDICTAMAWIRERIDLPNLMLVEGAAEPKPDYLDWDKPIEWSTGEEARFAPYDHAMPNHHVSSCAEWYDVTGDTHVAVDNEGQILGCEDEGYPTICNVRETIDG